MDLPVRKITFSITPGVAERLDRVSSYMHVSRSSLVNHLLDTATGDMCSLLDGLPESPENLSDGDLKRMRGASVRVIRDRLLSIEELCSDDL